MKLHNATRKLVESYGVDEAIDLVKNSIQMAKQAKKDNEDAGILCNEHLEEEIAFHREQLKILIHAKGVL